MIDTIDLSSINYYLGGRDLKVSPDKSVALLHDGGNLYSVKAPFDASASNRTTRISYSQMRFIDTKIDFDLNGRGFVNYLDKILVISPPYTAIDFTINLELLQYYSPTGLSGSVTLTPDNKKLLVSGYSGEQNSPFLNNIYVFDAPFIASSTPSKISTPCTDMFNIHVTPDGSKAIVVGRGEICIISAPFITGTSVVRLPFPTFIDDLDISSDGELAIFCYAKGAFFIKAPFDANSTIYDVPMGTSTGMCASRFLPSNLLAESLIVSKNALSSINTGGSLTYMLSYGNTGTTPVNNVVLRDMVPVGTSFVSATGSGTLQGNEVVWNIGTVAANTPAAGSVTFTVQVNAVPGAVLVNDDYSIEDDGGQMVQGNTVQTLVNNPPVYNLLTVSKTGAGGGIATSLSGINCGADCSETYDDGEPVIVTAVADLGSIFTGWSGDFSGTTCTVIMSTDRNVVANFDLVQYPLTVNKTGTGTGTVSSNPSGISCGFDCNQTYNDGQQVTLTAMPATGYIFTGWGGACLGTGTCTVTMNASKNVTATFDKAAELKVGKSGIGTGVITSSDTYINCGSLCRQNYLLSAAASVTLTATPNPGSSFVRWSNSCVGTNPTTTVKMSTARYCVATFKKP